MKNKIFFLLLIFSFSFSLWAQEHFTSEDMFRWFPEGKYEGALFKNNIAAQASEAFNYLEPLDFYVKSWNSQLHLPDTLKEHWLTCFQMTSVKIVVLDSNKEMKPGRVTSRKYVKVGEKLYRTNHFGYRLQVINFSPDLNLKKLALSCGGVEKTDKTFSTLSVFKCTLDKREKNEEDFYFCITPENEVLACVNLELLENMVLTRAGEFPSVLEKFPFPYLLDMVDDFPVFWQLYDSSSAFNAVLSKLKKDNVDNAVVDTFLQDKSFQTSLLVSLVFDFPYQTIIVSIPPDTTIPENYFLEAKLHREKLVIDDPLKENSSRYKVGEIEITSRLFAEEYVKSEILRREKYQKGQEGKTK